MPTELRVHKSSSNIKHQTAKATKHRLMLTRFYLCAIFLAAIIASTTPETKGEVAPTLDDAGGKPDQKATNHDERAMTADWTDDWWETYNPTKRPTRRPTTWKRSTRRPTRRPTTRRPTTRKPVGWAGNWSTTQPTRRPTKKPW
jgi:hypothetical protein